MLVLDAALVRADQPPLEQRGDHVDARHDLVRRFRPALDDGDLVLVAGRRQPGVALSSVGVNHRTGHHGTLDEGAQAVRGHILDAPKADAADAAAALLGRHRDDGLGLDFPSSLALFRAADISWNVRG